MENKIYNFLYNSYSSDITGNIPKLNYQLLVMSIRSLLPYEQRVGCELNMQRYNRECKMLKSYINGRDNIVENILATHKPCTAYDELLQYKIIPIIIANTYWKQALDESLKCVVFYTYSRKAILDTIIISSLIFDYFDNNLISKENAYENAKSRLIEFSIKKFYSDNLNVEIKSNYIINFEKERIQYLLKNNADELFSESKVMSNYIIGNEKSDAKEIISTNEPADSNVINNTNAKSEAGNKSVSMDNIEILKNLSSYLYKLRKGILDPSKIKFDLASDIDIRNYLNNKTFIHPVLGRCTIIAHKENEFVIKTKTGLVKVRV